jgi:hypothetical protein
MATPATLRVSIEPDLPEETKQKVGTKDVRGTTVYDTMNNAWASLLVLAYYLHLVPVIRPDDVWLLILSKLAAHVNKSPEHTEHYRQHFGDKDAPNEKKELEVHRSGIDLKNTDEVLSVFNELMHLVNERTTKAGIMSKLKADFSTSEPVHVLVSQVTLAEMVKEFYSFTMMLGCGLRAVELEGTAEDWRSVVSKIDAFSEIAREDARPYLKGCRESVMHFVDAYNGEVDRDLWKHFFYEENCGSGSQTEHAGWALNFFKTKHERGNGYTVHDERSTRVAYEFKISSGITTLDVVVDAGPVGVAPLGDGRIRTAYDFFICGASEVGLASGGKRVAQLSDIDFSVPGTYDKTTFDGKPLHAAFSNENVEHALIYRAADKALLFCTKRMGRPIIAFTPKGVEMANMWSERGHEALSAVCRFANAKPKKQAPEGTPVSTEGVFLLHKADAKNDPEVASKAESENQDGFEEE